MKTIKTDLHKRYPEALEIDMFDYMILEEKDTLYVWETAHHQCILIKDLRTDHIRNILSIMEEKPCWRQDQKPILEAELKQREIMAIIASTKNGELLYDN